jgi:spermidine/putrescine transport system permease protein
MSPVGWPGRLLLGLVLLFLYLPIAVMAVMAFNASPLYAVPIRWSLVWFERLPEDAKLLDATRNSLAIAAATALIATAVGTSAALGLRRLGGPLRAALELLLIPPIAIPWLIVGTAMLVFFFWVGVGRGLHAILLGHVALAIPYVTLIVGARLRSHGLELEEAAQSLGATPLQAFRRVTLPLLAPAVLTAALFAFAVSFDQFVVSYFLAGAGITTLPVEIYAAIRKGFTPEINAVCTLIILGSMLLVIPAALVLQRGRRP